MIARAVLFGLLTVATVTDIRWRKVFNWTTYPGIALGLLLNTLASLSSVKALQGTDPRQSLESAWQDGLVGCLACFGLMIVCYIFFDRMGGGDVKLMAMIGAFMGLYQGLEVLLWTFVVAACMALILLVWNTGPWTLVRRLWTYMSFAARHGLATRLTEDDRQPLQSTLFLSPSALIGVLIVHFQWI